MNYILKCSFALILFALAGCRNQPGGNEKSTDVHYQTKDLVTFILPQAVTDVSEVAQTHFLELLPYNTPRFQMKPRFVFIDRSEKVVGPTNALVDLLNFLHVAYYRDGSLVWRGSLLYGQGENPLCSTREGFLLGVRTLADQIEITFQDNERQFETQLSKTLDSLKWIEADGSKLFVYHYVVSPGMLAQ